jgi:hypothetical protein
LKPVIVSVTIVPSLIAIVFLLGSARRNYLLF